MIKYSKLLKPDLHFRLLNVLENNPDISQRELAKKLHISLGAVNYCLKALVDIGHVKAGNFKKNPKKSIYLYLLTPKGIAEKSVLAADFLKRKINEYHLLEEEIKDLESRSKI